mmetsp:Transcript_27231/g.109036  ORF Transcript_27231/g.109036 Transcript_27231/m.109036 type:complete len:245 (+) Transcript_27231:560-1294(+)
MCPRARPTATRARTPRSSRSPSSACSSRAPTWRLTRARRARGTADSAVRGAATTTQTATTATTAARRSRSSKSLPARRSSASCRPPRSSSTRHRLARRTTTGLSPSRSTSRRTGRRGSPISAWGAMRRRHRERRRGRPRQSGRPGRSPGRRPFSRTCIPAKTLNETYGARGRSGPVGSGPVRRVGRVESGRAPETCRIARSLSPEVTDRQDRVSRVRPRSRTRSFLRRGSSPTVCVTGHFVRPR